MSTQYKRMTEYLVGLGIEDVPHTKKTYLGHLIAVYRLMETHGCSEDACRAGMFHSLYGTERFQGFKIPLERRGEIREVIGERAERLAYLNCAMDRASFDRALEQSAGPYTFRDRLSGESVTLAQEDFDDLCRVHLYDFLEQIPRLQDWHYRRMAYRKMAERLGANAVQEYDRTFAQETAAR